MELFAAEDKSSVGRVLRAGTQGFTIGCQVRQLSGPSFGCLVKAQPVDAREAIFGLIYNMNVDDDPLVRRLILADNQPETVINDQHMCIRDSYVYCLKMEASWCGRLIAGGWRTIIATRFT